MKGRGGGEEHESGEVFAVGDDADAVFSVAAIINVDYGQGYGIEQPGPIKEILKFSKDKTSPSLKIVHNKP